MKQKIVSYLLTLFLSYSISSQSQVISVFVPSNAGLMQPNGLAFDINGNLYVANTTYGNNTISKVTPSGIVSTFVSANAGLSQPAGIAFDDSSNLYVSNSTYGNNTISKVTPSGIVSTFVSANAGLSQPSGLAFDASGNLYVSSMTYGNNTISKVTPNGIVSTFVGSNGGLSQPSGLAFDKSGNLYVSSMTYGNNTISKITPNGIVSTFVSATAGLSQPGGLAFDSKGNLYVTSITYGNNTISKVSSNGIVSTFIQSNAGLQQPSGLAFDKANYLYISNGTYGNNTIVRTTDSTLPIVLSSFSVQTKNNTLKIDWQTATELNTSQFSIQQSTDGISFKEIGIVKAIGSGGNIYDFTDNKPANGINYYRLQSVDKDGSSSYSKVVGVNFGNKQSFSIIPNPARAFATISFNKTVDKATIAVYDITGKAVFTQSFCGASAYKLNTQTLANGVYVIKVNTATESYNEKLFINK